MSLENEIIKLRQAIEENTAVLLGSQTPCTSSCSDTKETVATPAPPKVHEPVPAVPSAPKAVQPAPAVPAAPAVPTAPAHPAAAPAVPVVTKEQVNEILQAKAVAMGDGGAAIFGVLQNQFQAANVSSLDPSKYADLITAVNGLGA